MKIDDRINAMHSELTGWRRDLHAHPELGFEEHRTSDFVARKLEEFGLEVHRGIANREWSACCAPGIGNQAIGLRADMDALPIHEANDIPYKSTAPGRCMPAGMTATPPCCWGRRGTFPKPSDSTEPRISSSSRPRKPLAAAVMVEEGLMDRFPMSAVYGMHNWPGLPVGTIGAMIGPVMASMDIFEIEVTGLGTHAAMPHLGRDSIVAGANLVSTLQTIASQSIAPTDAVVVSVTQFHAGEAWNVIPETVNIRGTVRTLDRQVQEGVEPALRRICEGLAHAHGIAMDLKYTYGYPVTVNTAAETEFAREVGSRGGRDDNVRTGLAPSMGAEDFAFMLEKRPGCYVWLGNGPTNGGQILHNPHYDFNDDILPIGVAYWGELVERALPPRAADGVSS